MSQDLPENVNITEADLGTSAGSFLPLGTIFAASRSSSATATGDHQHPPQSAPTQEPQGLSNFVDGSGHIFSMYLEMATEEDKKLVEDWKADADGILIFVRLEPLVWC